MVIWIWIGAVVMLAGTLITTWSDAREARQRVTAQVRDPAGKAVGYAHGNRARGTEFGSVSF